MGLEKPVDLFDPDALLRRPGARLMVLAPHPDDESLAAGGLIQRALGYGVSVSVAFVSDGENNPWPQRVLERRLRIGPYQRVAWAARRRREADAALCALGSGIRSIRLGWPDGGITGKLLDDAGGAVAALRELLVQERPTLLVLPDLGDCHPDHSAVRVLVEMAIRGLPDAARPDCLGYVLHGGSRPAGPQRAVLVLGPGEVGRKRAAIAAHGSQMALGRRRLLRWAGATEAFIAGFDRDGYGGECLPWVPPRWLRRRLALLVVDGGGAERVGLDGAAADGLRWRDGSPAARLPRALQAPFYIKLYSPLRSPWIFDAWGWCRVGSAGA